MYASDSDDELYLDGDQHKQEESKTQSHEDTQVKNVIQSMNVDVRSWETQVVDKKGVRHVEELLNIPRIVEAST